LAGYEWIGDRRGEGGSECEPIKILSQSDELGQCLKFNLEYSRTTERLKDRHTTNLQVLETSLESKNGSTTQESKVPNTWAIPQGLGWTVYHARTDYLPTYTNCPYGTDRLSVFANKPPKTHLFLTDCPISQYRLSDQDAMSAKHLPKIQLNSNGSNNELARTRDELDSERTVSMGHSLSVHSPECVRGPDREVNPNFQSMDLLNHWMDLGDEKRLWEKLCLKSWSLKPI
jgi:hypothetical protein